MSRQTIEMTAERAVAILYEEIGPRRFEQIAKYAYLNDAEFGWDDEARRLDEIVAELVDDEDAQIAVAFEAARAIARSYDAARLDAHLSDCAEIITAHAAMGTPLKELLAVNAVLRVDEIVTLTDQEAERSRLPSRLRAELGDLPTLRPFQYQRVYRWLARAVRERLLEDDDAGLATGSRGG